MTAVRPVCRYTHSVLVSNGLDDEKTTPMDVVYQVLFFNRFCFFHFLCFYVRSTFIVFKQYVIEWLVKKVKFSAKILGYLLPSEYGKDEYLPGMYLRCSSCWLTVVCVFVQPGEMWRDGQCKTCGCIHRSDGTVTVSCQQQHCSACQPVWTICKSLFFLAIDEEEEDSSS